MAKTISDEKMKLSIIINGNEAQKELFDLEKSTRSLKKANSDLLFEQKLIEKQLGKDSKEYKDLSVQIKANTATINANKEKMTELQNQLGLTGLTMKQLGDKAKMLRMQLLNAVPGGDTYKKYTAELEQVNSRIGQLKGNASTAKMSIGSLADSFNRYQGMAIATVAALTGVALSIQKIIDINGKLSDAQSDVMKTTGMTKIEVDELTKSFGILQTRTSRIDLLGIAEQGGRIGIAKAEIGDFVNVMNKASVSLGDSFTGGAEEVASKLGKIKFLFEETKGLNVEQAYNSIGSAINDLGANGVASEANIAEFTTRIGSLTDVLKPTIQETLALGTAFEESGIEAEVSARAYNIFMKQASTESAKFAKVMGISQKSVEDMINANPLDFMMKFAEGMRGMDATDTAKTLDYLGVNADGANKVIGAMGNNMGRFRELIDLSNNSFASGTSLINEYTIKNNNLAATLEKISKTVSGWFSSETFIKWLTASVQIIGKLIGATEDADGSVGGLANKVMAFIKIITVGIVTLFSYQAGLQLVSLWTARTATATALSNLVFKIQYYWLVAQEIATKALALTQSLLTFKIAEVRKAYVALMATMSLNPWAALVAIIGAATASYFAFRESANETNKTLDNQILINQKVSDQVSEQKQKVSDLIAIMKDENASIEQKKTALAQLQKIAGGYLDTLTQENIATAEGERLINRYIIAIDRLANAKAIQDVKTELNKEKIKGDNKILALSLEKKSTKNEGMSSMGDDGKLFGLGARNKIEIQAEIEAEKEKQTQLSFQITALENTKTAQVKRLQGSIANRINLLKKTKKDSQRFNELTADNLNDNKALNLLIGLESTTTEVASKSNFNVPGGKGNKTTENAKKKQDDANKKFIEDAKKLNEDRIKIEREAEDARLANLTESYQKEMQLEQINYDRKIQDLKAQLIKEEEIKVAYANASNPKLSEQERDFWKATADKWKSNNDANNSKIVSTAQAHNLKISTLEAKGVTEALAKKKEAFDQGKILRDTKFNEELAALGTNKKAKEKFTEKHELDELAHQETFLKELIDDFNKIIGKGTFNEIDLSLLTPEQVQSFTNEAAKVGLTLSELIAKKNELTGKEKESNAQALSLAATGEADIFGFTPSNWLQLHDNLAAGKVGVEEMIMAVGALTNAYSMYSQFLESNEKKQIATFEKNTNTKKQKLKQQLDSGRISQEQYNTSVDKLDADLAKKKAVIENKQAKRQKAIAIANIAMSTAQAILGIWAQFPKFDFGVTAAIMSGVVGALGLAQIAMVMKQPLPSATGAEEGLYPEYVKRQQDGKVFQSKYQGKTRSGLVKDTSHFLVAENGPEMVIDNKAWRQMNPAVKDSLIRELQGIKGFEQGLYNNETKRYEVPATSGTTNDTAMMSMMMSLLAENVAVLKDIKESGILAIVSNRDYTSMKNIKDGIKKYDDLRKSNKL